MCLGLFALQDNIPSLLKDESRERSAAYFISLPPGSSTRSFSSSCFYTSQSVPTLRIFVAPRKRGIRSIDNFWMSVRYAACVRISWEVPTTRVDRLCFVSGLILWYFRGGKLRNVQSTVISWRIPTLFRTRELRIAIIPNFLTNNLERSSTLPFMPKMKL